MTDFYERVAALRREGQAFATATVVARQAPVSAHLGDHAIVYADGRMEGFVGGSCSRDIVRRQALAALASRRGRLVSIRPGASGQAASSDDHVVIPMSCTSEGAVDVFVEPFVRARALVVVGATPVADALARLGRAMEYDVTRVVDATEQRDLGLDASHGTPHITLDQLAPTLAGLGPDIAAVVASQGHYDEPALEVILKHGAAYVGLLASRKRGAVVRTLLAEQGVERVASIRSPVGLDLGARTPAEVALSILAEIVQMMPATATISEHARADHAPDGAGADHAAPHVAAPTHAVDPVCRMDVEIAAARFSAEVGGTTYYFCCPHCRAHFLKDPQSFLSQAR